jgi:hypothetical protein
LGGSIDLTSKRQVVYLLKKKKKKKIIKKKIKMAQAHLLTLFVGPIIWPIISLVC